MKGRWNNLKFATTLVPSFLKRWTTSEKKSLGRWTIDYCDKKLDSKIDMANEDHCGPCGQYVLDKTEKDPLPKVPTKVFETMGPIKSI
jgi:hypothetical protein